MRTRGHLARIVTAALVAAPLTAAAVAAPAQAATETQTSFSWTSAAGDFIGQGRSGSRTDVAAFRISGSAGRVSVDIAAGTSERWTVELAAPVGRQLTPGSYENITRSPFNTTYGGLSVTSGSRGCNATKGRFTVFAITSDARGDVTSLDASFTQFCDAGTGALSGTIKYAAPYVVPIVLTASTDRTVEGQDVTLTARVAPGATGGPVFYDGTTPIGQGSYDANGLASLTTDRLGVGTHDLYARVGGAQSARLQHTVVDNATSLWFSSGNGDYIGQGRTTSHVTGESSVVLRGDASYASLAVTGPGGSDYWTVDVAAPPGETLQPDTVYLDAVRAPFRGAGQPGLEVAGNGRGCNTVAGDFHVHRIQARADGSLELLEVSFVQHCEGPAAPPLTGWARWNAASPATSTVALTAAVTAPLQVRVTAAVSGGSATPTGSVSLQEGGTVLGTAPLDASGSAALTLTLARGAHQLSAVYSGDSTHAPATTSRSVTVPGHASTTSLSAVSTGPRAVGLTASVTGGGPSVPQGSVTFTEGASVLGVVPLDGTGRATLPWTTTRGGHTVTASYVGSTTHEPSSASSQVVVVGDASSTVVSVARTAKLGKAAAVTVTVGPGGLPTGSVRLHDGAEPVGVAATLSGGRATISWTPTAKGSRSLTVRYAGDTRYEPSVSAATVVKVT